MGHRAQEKHFLPEHMSLPKKQMRILLDGYKSDAYMSPKRPGSVQFIYGTTSELLIKQLNIMQNILGEPLHLEWRSNSGGAGKNPLPISRGYYNPNSRFIKNRPTSSGHYRTTSKNESDNLEWFEVKSIEELPPEPTFDIGVEKNHNFILWNDILAHNCEDWAILACDCLYEWNKCYYLCMYTADSGHATLLISKKEKEYDVECLWLSVGTFGLQEHGGTIQDLITDWSGFENWTMAVLMDDTQDVLEVYYN